MTEVPSRYLTRLAVVYLRQSTERQVRENEGSRMHQEDLRQRAIDYGWPPERVLVISTDLGRSGMRADRPGYQELLKLIREGRVGALFVSDVSCGGRHDRVWFDLLALLGEMDVLLWKGAGLTDPGDRNQVFVTKIEAVVAHRENEIRFANLHKGRLSKAKHGKAVSAPPVGFVPVFETRDGIPTKTGAWHFDDDLAVREAIDGIFAAFREGRSLRKAVTLLNERGIKIPARRGTMPTRTKARRRGR